MSKRTRTLFYRRAIWDVDEQENLQYYLDKAHQEIEDKTNRDFMKDEGRIQCISEIQSNGYSYYHITYYEQGSKASTIPKVENPSDTVDECEAPEGREFMEGEIFVVLKGNDMTMCASGTRESTAIEYFYRILKKSGQEDLNTKFGVQSVADVNKANILAREGVKSIDLNCALYKVDAEETESHQEETLTKKFRGAAYNLLKPFLEKNRTWQDLQEEEKINVKLIISSDKRYKNDLILQGEERLKTIAEQIEDDENIKIKTNKGNVLTQEEIKISKTAKFDPYGNGIRKIEAWEKLEEYHETLKEAGIIE